MGGAPFPRSRAGPLLGVWLALGLLLAGGRAAAGEPAASDLPELGEPPALGALAGRPIARIDVVHEGRLWASPVALRRVRAGDLLSPELARLAIAELGDAGRYADVRAEAEATPGGVVLRLRVVPRRVIEALRILGPALDEDDCRRASGLDSGSELVESDLDALAARIRELHVSRGYPAARVRVAALDTDDPLRVVVVVRVTPGPESRLGRVVLRVFPAPDEALAAIVGDYAVAPGDRADEEALADADRALTERLRREGHHRAEVTHRLAARAAGAEVEVEVQAGPRLRLRFEGNRSIDAAELEQAGVGEDSDDPSVQAVAARVTRHYVERGFLDARVTPELRGDPLARVNDLVLRVEESERVVVDAREYPCLTGERGPGDVGEEIDGFLSDALPGATVLGPVEPARVDALLGPRNVTGARVAPLDENPWRTYVPEVYERATRHLTELYRSEGYLSAQVGPAVPLRRACAARAPGPGCVPVGERAAPRVSCALGPAAPAERALGASCEPDPALGRRCEPRVLVQIPVRLGPRALLWDLAFEGNRRLSERELAAVADLGLGEPVSQVALEEGRRRLIEEYQELGYAFADVALRLELSQDRTRARARFLVTERGEVQVSQILVRGARATRESRVLGRVALRAGGLYRKSLVRATEERLGTLGVFSSVDVALEDPEVYAARKVVIVTVRETAPQYLDVRPGFSTGDGFRITFEYGHRNLGGEAIRLTLRSQLGLLPDAFIFDPTVRRRFAALALDERLERRNTLSVEFPEVGLGPLFPLGVDGVDVRDNSRDFGLTKAAAIVTQSYRPTPRFVAQLGASLERNVADIFQSDATLEEFIRQNPATGARLRVPEGITRVVAERASATWDRRDDPFNATRGTLVSAAVEHVFAEPTEPDSLTPTSEFLRLTGKLGGYLRLSPRGHSLALAVRAGQNVQLTRTSRTYPDRLFFSGGVDSLRGFLQDSLIPEDVAARIVADARRAGDPGVDRSSLLTADKVVIRGGNLVVSPRAELRVPLGGVLATAVFLDAGNLWLDPGRFDPLRLRTAAGTGLRANTPVGPLALDLGVNLARRAWEDPFAVHFSIGLF